MLHPLQIFLLIGALLFVLGVFLVLTRRNAVMALMGVELMLNAANVNFIGFSRYDQVDLDGQMAALFVIVLAAAEVAVGLALIVNLYRRTHSIDLGDSSHLRG